MLNRLNTWQWAIITFLSLSALFLYYSSANPLLIAMTQGYFYNGLHFPGGLGLGIIIAILILRENSRRDVIMCLLLLASITALLELLQTFRQRNASLDDWVYGYIASCLGLSIAIYWRINVKGLLFFSFVSAIFLTILINITSFINTYNYLTRHQQLPLLTSFEKTWIDSCAWRPTSKYKKGFQELPEVIISDIWSSNGINSLLVKTTPGYLLGVRSYIADNSWLNYQFLSFEVFNASSDFELLIEIYPEHLSRDQTDNSHITRPIRRGLNHIKIPIEKLYPLKEKPEDKLANSTLSITKRLALLVKESETGQHFAIDNLRLVQ